MRHCLRSSARRVIAMLFEGADDVASDADGCCIGDKNVKELIEKGTGGRI